jgi:hypothetical protein
MTGPSDSLTRLYGIDTEIERAFVLRHKKTPLARGFILNDVANSELAVRMQAGEEHIHTEEGKGSHQ